jgi:hypothetical protein
MAGSEMKVIADELKLRTLPRMLHEDCPKNHTEKARRMWPLLEESPWSLCSKNVMALRSINIAEPMAGAALSLLGLGDEDNCRRTEEELPPEDECWRP